MSDYANGIDYLPGFQWTPPPSMSGDGDYEPDYQDYLDECDGYDEALSVDLELAGALADDRLEWIEVRP